MKTTKGDYSLYAEIELVDYRKCCWCCLFNYNKCCECCVFSMTNLCLAIVVLLIFCVSYVFPIIEFIMTAKYKNDIICDSFLSLVTWMYVQAFISLGIMTGFAYYVIKMVVVKFSFTKIEENIDKNIFTNLFTIFRVPMNMLVVFQSIWLTVGCIIFWRDCSDLKPKPINTLYWIVLICGFGYVFVYMLLIFRKTIKKNNYVDSHNLPH